MCVRKGRISDLNLESVYRGKKPQNTQGHIEISDEEKNYYPSISSRKGVKLIFIIYRKRQSLLKCGLICLDISKTIFKNSRKSYACNAKKFFLPLCILENVTAHTFEMQNCHKRLQYFLIRESPIALEPQIYVYLTRKHTLYLCKMLNCSTTFKIIKIFELGIHSFHIKVK